VIANTLPDRMNIHSCREQARLFFCVRCVPKRDTTGRNSLECQDSSVKNCNVPAPLTTQPTLNPLKRSELRWVPGVETSMRRFKRTAMQSFVGAPGKKWLFLAGWLTAFSLIPVTSLAQTPAERIAAEIDNSARAMIKGTHPPMARPENDAGRLTSDIKLHGINIVFSRSAVQEADLQALIALSRVAHARPICCAFRSRRRRHCQNRILASATGFFY
jgi:hypothetical protein